MRKSAALVAILVVVTSVGLSRSQDPALGDSGNPATGGLGAVPPETAVLDKALEDDVAVIAADLGVSAAEVMRQMALQDAMDQIDFRAIDPGYTEDRSEMGKDFRLIYRSTSPPTRELNAALAATGALASVDFEQVPYTIDELRQARQNLDNYLRKETSLVFASTLDTKSGSVVILTEETVGEATRSVADEQARNGPSIQWDLEEFPKPAALPGGRALNGSNLCTGGFVVYNPNNGERGLSTAGHCANDQRYEGYQLNVRRETPLGFYDLQWADRAAITWGAKVYDGSGERVITARRHSNLMDPGDPLAKWGRTTLFSNGYIDDGNYICSYCDGESPRMKFSTNSGVRGGDSGGPIMIGGIALGLTTDAYPNGDGLFMPQNWTLQGIGMIVLTQ